MISSLITLVVILLIFGLLWYAITLIPLPAPVPLILQIVFILIAVIILADLFLGGPGCCALNFHR